MKNDKKGNKFLPHILVAVFICIVGIVVIYFIDTSHLFMQEYHATSATTHRVHIIPPSLNKTLYNKTMLAMANNPVPKPVGTSTATSTPQPILVSSATSSVSILHKLWPTSAVYPQYGALLPFNRIVAYYGNFYSTKMGVLGAYPPEEMLSMLMNEVTKWQLADPTTPVIPAVDYIAVTAQGSPGVDGMYRARMPGDQIQKAIDLANQVHGIVFLDVQVGLSNLQTELPLLAPYLKLPNVHLSIDPEFSMKSGARPGTIIGTFDASDVNYAAQLLANIVHQHDLPPKILVVHRFTAHMVTNAESIVPLPEVQVVMDMDGWGPQAQKLKTYHDYIYDEPVQFTGFKLFYKNDVLPPSTGMLTPEQLLQLTPRPIYIQYQ